MLGESLDRMVRKGHNQGVREGRLEAARRMLLRGFPVADVVDLTGLSETAVRKLANAKAVRPAARSRR